MKPWKEWSVKNQFNSFNSWKGLLYQDWYKSIRDWKDGKRAAPNPPVEASLDPIHACNLLCDHCNAHRYLTDDTSRYRMSDDHLINLTKFLGKWGVKAVCYGGGGEPTLHTKLGEALKVCHESGMQSSIATNATNFSDELIVNMAKYCRWVGISIDSATPSTYKIGRKADFFHKAIDNMVKLQKEINRTNSKCEISYKFLIFDYNQYEIFQACELAKKLGVRDFHCRPADYSHQGMGELKAKIGGYNVDFVLEQFAKCRELETEDFRVFTIVHKFDENFKPKKNFTQCYASPCCIQLCANGSVYLCPDQRFTEDFKLGEHSPNPEAILDFWGSEKHKKLALETGFGKCTTRCTFSPYNEQCERLFINNDDPMCWVFI